MRVLSASIVAAILAVSATAASGATSVHCHAPAQGQGPKNDRSLPIGNVTARGISCRAARSAIRRGTFKLRGGCFRGPNLPPCRSSFATRGFHCTAPRLGLIRCTGRAHPARRFSFAWGE